MSTCEKCGADVLKVRNFKGNIVQLDAEPFRMAVLRDVSGDVPKIEDIVDCHQSHKATCEGSQQ